MGEEECPEGLVRSFAVEVEDKYYKALYIIFYFYLVFDIQMQCCVFTVSKHTMNRPKAVAVQLYIYIYIYKPGIDVFYHQGSGTASQATPRGRYRICAEVGFELAIQLYLYLITGFYADYAPGRDRLSLVTSHTPTKLKGWSRICEQRPLLQNWKVHIVKRKASPVAKKDALAGVTSSERLERL
jgi:hypothetical protein